MSRASMKYGRDAMKRHRGEDASNDEQSADVHHIDLTNDNSTLTDKQHAFTRKCFCGNVNCNIVNSFIAECANNSNILQVIRAEAKFFTDPDNIAHFKCQMKHCTNVFLDPLEGIVLRNRMTKLHADINAVEAYVNVDHAARKFCNIDNCKLVTQLNGPTFDPDEIIKKFGASYNEFHARFGWIRPGFILPWDNSLSVIGDYRISAIHTYNVPAIACTACNTKVDTNVTLSYETMNDLPMGQDISTVLPIGARQHVAWNGVTVDGCNPALAVERLNRTGCRVRIAANRNHMGPVKLTNPHNGSCITGSTATVVVADMSGRVSIVMDSDNTTHVVPMTALQIISDGKQTN